MVLPPDSGRTLDPERLLSMRDTLSHRGPDDRGAWFGPSAALGQRRLSIVDLEGGGQPMSGDDGRVHLVYNGEIYNHRRLRALLEDRGHRYRSRSDTETVLRIFLERGDRGLRHLSGMFAFALWNQNRDELFLARDRLGIKPLYYAHLDDGALLFASEIKALLASGLVPPELEPGVLPDLLANRAPSGERTLFRGIRRIPPGHHLTWHEGEVELRSYWSVPQGHSPNTSDEKTLIRRFRGLFTKSVERRLMADVPLGVFLSGGIDSSAIAAVMDRLMEGRLKTFSVAFKDRQANELRYARLMADKLSADHHEVVVGPGQFFESLPHLVWHEDEPIAHPSSVPLHFVAKLARKHVKVVLTGEGSDELLGGYGRYSKTLLNRLAGRAIPGELRPILRAIVGCLPSGSTLRSRLERTSLCLPADLENLYLDNFAVFSRREQADLFTESALTDLSDVSPYTVHSRLLNGREWNYELEDLLYLDLHTYLRELLMKQDQMSMSASLESRVPFLDHELVEFATGLPRRMKIRGRTTKWILREAMRELLPAPILSRSKMGFPVPFGRWIRGWFSPVVQEFVLGDRALERGLFRPERVRRVYRKHVSGRRGFADKLWLLLNIEIWFRLFIDGDPRGEVADTMRRITRRVEAENQTRRAKVGSR